MIDAGEDSGIDANPYHSGRTVFSASQEGMRVCDRRAALRLTVDR